VDKPRKVEEVGFPKRMKMLKIGFYPGWVEKMEPKKVEAIGVRMDEFRKFWENWNLRRLNPRKFRDMDFQTFIQKLEMCSR
jgi:4-alpha-glucanotransferase